MELEKLGPYVIGRTLGRGGMGTVYAAVHEDSGQHVAIKVLSAPLAADEGFRDRFESEIETLRKLHHPNIVRLYGFGEEQGHLFYSMELVDGTSLEDELRNKRRFDWREVTQIAVQTCRALKHAHDHGVIHRDIKPANLMLTSDGNVKLSDFGIAKLFGSQSMTAAGGVLGTAEFMAPEQADGRPVTHRCDLYSLGGVMYALLAGRPPFRAASLPEMLQLQRYAEPDPVRRYAHETPVELEEIVTELLAKEPADRIANALVLGRRLEAMYHGLLAREARAEESTGDGSDFDLSPPEGSDHTSSELGPTIATQGPTDKVSNAKPERSDSSTQDRIETRGAADDAGQVPDKPETQPTLPPPSPADEEGYTLAGGPDDDTLRGTASRQPATRFTTVEQEAVRLSEEEPSTHPLASPQTWVLVAALSMIVAGAWYFSRPASADSLYETVAAAARSGEIEALIELEEKMREFCLRFPNDERRAQIDDYLLEIELDREQRRFDRRAKRVAAVGGLSSIEQAYFEAISLVNSDPERAETRLQALIDLYANAGDVSKDDRECLELAARQVARLRLEVETLAAQNLSAIDERLAKAAALAPNDPEAARSIWQAIIELYAEKPWAAEKVAIARQALGEASSGGQVSAVEAGR